MYISPSQIVETGYTQGLRFVINYSQEYYKGFYHKDNQGRYWTGETHTAQSILLSDLYPNPSLDYSDNNVSIKDSPLAYTYKKRYQNDLSTPLLKSDFIIPTETDYNNGYFIRYFAKLKISEKPYIVELNNSNYTSNSRSVKIAIYYSFISMPWQLVGPINDVYNNNIRVTSGIKNTNLRSIQYAEKTIEDLSTYLTDPLQYARI